MNILLKHLLKESNKGGKVVLFKNEWVSLMSTPDPKGLPYIYSHETRCNGNIVAVLLYERIGRDCWKYGLRSEITPSWGGEPQLSSLTGGVEALEPIDAAIKEIKEEAGLIVKKEDLKSLGTCRGTKSSDTIYTLFALDISGIDKVKPTGKDVGKIIYLGRNEAMKRVVCPIWYVMFSRLGLE